MTTGTMSSDEAGEGELGRAGEGGAVFLGEDVITTCEGSFTDEPQRRRSRVGADTRN